MANSKQGTLFLQSERDFPSPNPSFAPLQAPMDEPQPAEDLFTQSLTEGLPDPVDYPHWVNNLIMVRRREERERLPMRTAGDLAWSRYNNRFDFSSKEDWQAKKVSPKVYITVERLAATIYEILEKSRDWFKIDSLDEGSMLYYNMVKKLASFFLDHDTTNFKKIFRKCLKSGLLSQMMYLLVCWEDGGVPKLVSDPADEEEEKPQQTDDPVANFFTPTFDKLTDQTNVGPIMPGKKMPKLCVKALNPDYVYLDHTGRNRYMIWEVRYTRGEARREARLRNWDADAVERALTRPFTTENTTDTMAGFHEVRDADKQDRIPDHRSYQVAKITYFMGDFFDEVTGEILMENCMFTMMNDAEIVDGPYPNPFWDGEFPIIAAPMTEVPFAAYGKSPIVQNIDMFDLWIETMNMMVDYFHSVLLGMKEVDLDLIDDYDDDFRSGFYPGKAIKKRANGQPNAMAVSNVPFSDVPPGLWQFLQVHQKELQDNVMLTDAIGGQARTRGRVTAMEFNRRAADAGTILRFLFETLQDGFLAPAVRKVFHTLLQFMPQHMWSNWVETHAKSIRPTDEKLAAEWDANFAAIKTWNPKERWRNLAGYFRFKVEVFSVLGDRQEEIEKNTFFLQTASQVPGAAQHLKYPNILRNIARAMGWDPEEVVSAEALAVPVGVYKPIDPLDTGNPDNEIAMSGLPQPGGFNLGAPQSISTSPPSFPGAGGPGLPP